MTGETTAVRSDKKKPREDIQNHRYHRYHRYQRYHRYHRYHRKTTYIGRNTQHLKKSGVGIMYNSTPQRK